MDFFSRKKRQREKEAQEAARIDWLISGGIAAGLKEAQTAAANETRKNILAALSGTFSLAVSKSLTWHRSVIDRLVVSAQTWYEKRAKAQAGQITQRFETRATELLASAPAALMQHQADVYRQNLIMTIAKESKNFFQKATEERMKDFARFIQEQVLLTRGSLESGDIALPNGVRFFFKNAAGRQVYVIEQAPSVRTITFELKRPDEHQDIVRNGRFKLAFPFMVFIVELDKESQPSSLFVFFRNEPLRSVNDELFMASLPNITPTDESVCLRFPLMHRNSSPAETVACMLQCFWGSTFNDDYLDHIFKAMRTHAKMRNLKTWQRNSRRNPAFMLNLSWETSRNRTVNGYIRTLLGAPNPSLDKEYARLQGELTRIAERVASDTMASASTLIQRWKIDEVPGNVLSNEFSKLRAIAIEELTCAVAISESEIFAEVPDPAAVHRAYLEQQRALESDIEERIGRIGLASAPSA